MEDFDYEVMWREEKPFADRLATWTKNVLQPKRVVDLGCGPGMYVTSLREAGVQAFGYDIDERAKDRLHLGVHHTSMFEVNDPADVVFCIEVAEHIPDTLEGEVVKAMSRNTLPGGTLVWSAAHPGQGGVGHINCRPKEHWSALLQKEGLRRDYDREEQMKSWIRTGYHMGWFTMNAMVFVKSVVSAT
jgi:2-polyprenyl-3-methyl-5-hydroxy-6-metoxy-1,4-benzoquinol methylase